MRTRDGSAEVGFHEGELAVQHQAGVTAQAARLSGMLAPTDLRGGLTRFLADRTFAVITGRDGDERLWASPLTGAPGFLDVATPTTLVVHTAALPGDPLHEIRAGQPVGMVVVEFATRRRVRINGVLTAASDSGLTIEVEQAYGNCPQYIQRRQLTPAERSAVVSSVRQGGSLDELDIDLIHRSDTFFIGSAHPTRGADVSHRGGPAGFVRVEQGALWWPDYNGNNMFNTFGNLAVDPSAALLFADFSTGATLQLSGTAELTWIAAGLPGDDDHTGRRLRFTPEALVSGQLLSLRADTTLAYDKNPRLTDRR